MSNYTYMLECSDKSLYTGWTNDLPNRIKKHQQGKGGHYTHAKRPVKLVYFEEFETKQEAMRRECAIKNLKRKEKEALIQTPLKPEQMELLYEINEAISH